MTRDEAKNGKRIVTVNMCQNIYSYYGTSPISIVDIFLEKNTGTKG